VIDRWRPCFQRKGKSDPLKLFAFDARNRLKLAFDSFRLGVTPLSTSFFETLSHGDAPRSVPTTFFFLNTPPEHAVVNIIPARRLLLSGYPPDGRRFVIDFQSTEASRSVCIFQDFPYELFLEVKNERESP